MGSQLSCVVCILGVSAALVIYNILIAPSFIMVQWDSLLGSKLI